MKSILSFAAAVLMVCAAGTVTADENKSAGNNSAGNKAECNKAECNKSQLTKSDGTCPIAAAMDELPQLAFVVGETQLCCENSAAAVAKQTGGTVQYLVAKRTYDDKHEAMVALADATEAFVADFAKPHTCNVSGKTTVAGTTTSCEVTAGKLAQITKEAIDGVTLAYQVGDEQCSCPNQAASLAAATGQEKRFVIGKETTSCAIDARIKLARAKYEAAVKALATAQAQEQQATQS